MLSLLAQTADPTGTATPSAGGGIAAFLPFLLIILLFVFMMRKQGRQRRQHMDLVTSVEIGDEVETIAGMFGTVRRATDDMLWVELAPGAEVKMARAAVRRKVMQFEPPSETGGA
jgi:preprotein translocase subunit YajC